MEPLGVGDLVHDGVLYDKINEFADDLPFYTTWCRQAAGDVLELCCGTGRLTIPLRQAGVSITGLDFTPSMLDRARVKAREANVDLELVQGDMRAFDLGRTFGLIFIPFNSLQNTYTRSDLERIFACVHRHLAPSGRFIVEVFNPDIRYMLDRDQGFSECARFTLDDGRPGLVLQQCRYDAATQVNRAIWKFRLGDEEHVQKLDMRCFFPEELDALLTYNGFTILRKFGAHDESAFVSASPKQICICRPTCPWPGPSTSRPPMSATASPFRR